MKSEYKRAALIKICEDAIVPETQWRNRDSSDAQQQIGQAWALLRAGCEYQVLTEGDLKTDGSTVWVEITHAGFGFF